MRPIDEPIPLAEELYRGATDEDIVGGAVIFTVIDPKGVSCNRQKYGTPDSVLTALRNRIVVTTPNELELLPRRVTLNNGFEYEIFAVDDPKEGHAHSEIRWRRTDVEPSQDHTEIKSSKAKLEMRVYVARAFRPFVSIAG